MKKTRAVVVSLMMMFLLTACTGEKSADTNTVSIDKKGTVTETIVEEFAQSYYDADELKEMIDQEVADYNAKAGENSVTVKTFEVEEGKVKLVRTYTSYEDYAALNHSEFFAGTVAEAYDAGYSFEDMVSPDGSTTLTKQSVLENGESKIVICDVAGNVRVSGKITYISEDVEVQDHKTATVLEDGEISYILYQ